MITKDENIKQFVFKNIKVQFFKKIDSLEEKVSVFEKTLVPSLLAEKSKLEKSFGRFQKK